MEDKQIFVNRDSIKDNFTILPNAMLGDERLTWRARGILGYMISKPVDWVFYESELINHGKEGRDAFRRAFKELKDCGYVKKIKITDDKGKILRWETHVSSTPSHFTEKPQCGKPTLLENHNVDNRTLQSNDYNNTDIQEKDNKTLPQQVEAIDWEDLFDQFYSMYPKKVNKKKAFDKFKLKYKKHGLDTIMKGTASYAKVMELNQQDKQYIKGPDVFLNGEHYLDDHSELLKKKPNQQMAYKPWEEEFNNGYTTNSYANENHRTELPGTTKQIGW